MHVIPALWYVFNCLFYLCDFSKLSLSNLKFNAANTCINCRIKPTFNETIRTVPMSWQWHTGLPFVLKSAISANVCLFVANSLPEMKWQFLKKFWPLLVLLWCLENWTFLILLMAKFGHFLFLGLATGHLNAKVAWAALFGSQATLETKMVYVGR